MEITPKGCQHGAKIDAEIHQKPIQELVAEQIKKNIKNHVFLMCKIMQIHHTVVKKQGFARRVREREIHEQSIKMRAKSMPKSMKNLCKIHARKREA